MLAGLVTFIVVTLKSERQFISYLSINWIFLGHLLFYFIIAEWFRQRRYLHQTEKNSHKNNMDPVHNIIKCIEMRPTVTLM